MDFSIRGRSPSANTGVIELLIDNDNSWNTITISYMVSARDEFYLGTYIVPANFIDFDSAVGGITHNFNIPNLSLIHI